MLQMDVSGTPTVEEAIRRYVTPRGGELVCTGDGVRAVRVLCPALAASDREIGDAVAHAALTLGSPVLFDAQCHMLPLA